MTNFERKPFDAVANAPLPRALDTLSNGLPQASCRRQRVANPNQKMPLDKLGALDAEESGLPRARPLGRVEWTCHIGQRTEFCLPLSFTISNEKTHIHQQIGREAFKLKELGWSYAKIAKRLGVTDKTVKKAIERL